MHREAERQTPRPLSAGSLETERGSETQRARPLFTMAVSGGHSGAGRERQREAERGPPTLMLPAPGHRQSEAEGGRRREQQWQRRRPTSAGPSLSSPSALREGETEGQRGSGNLPLAMNMGASMRGPERSRERQTGSLLPSFSATSSRARPNTERPQAQQRERAQRAQQQQQQLGAIGTAQQARNGRFLQHVNV